LREKLRIEYGEIRMYLSTVINDNRRQ
jgi:hypothetical protein